MLKVYMDIDGCLRDLFGAADRLYQEQFPGEEIITVDNYDLSQRYPRWGEDTWDILFRQYVDQVFNLDAEPHEGAIEALNWLASQDDVIVKLLSKQDKWRREATDLWLDNQGVDPSIERIYVEDISKGEYLLGENDDLMTVMIDDSPDEIESAMGIVDYPVIVIRNWNKTFRDANPEFMQISNVTIKALQALSNYL